MLRMGSDSKAKRVDPTKSSSASRTNAGASTRPSSGAKIKAAPEDAEGKPEKGTPKRKLGIKGAAPWAARHAAKHAAEARARAAQPAPPGSARATIRTPSGADELKEKLNELLKLTNQIKLLRKNLPKHFHEIGVILRDVQAKRLFEPRGYTSFDVFVERETELGKDIGLKLMRIGSLFTADGAMELGYERAMQLVGTLDQPREYASEQKIAIATPVRPPTVGRPAEPSGRAV